MGPGKYWLLKALYLYSSRIAGWFYAFLLFVILFFVQNWTANMAPSLRVISTQFVVAMLVCTCKTSMGLQERMVPSAQGLFVARHLPSSDRTYKMCRFFRLSISVSGLTRLIPK
jgi:hypothetical protein